MQKDLQLHSNNEDSVLFQLIKQRDKNAFTQIYNKYHRYLYILAFRFLKNDEMAEDAVQYVFVKLWINTRNINVEVNLKNYLYTMTKNYILNQIRDKKEIISINYEYAQKEIEDENGDIQKMFEETQLSDLLYKGIDSLPHQKKEICRKKIQENKSNQEIADEMGLSVHTVKSHYQESIKLLRTYFQKFMIFFLFIFNF